MAASARFFCAAGASASTRAALRASRPMARIVASSFAGACDRLERSVHGLDPSVLRGSYHVWRGPARRPQRRRYPQQSTAIGWLDAQIPGTGRMRSVFRPRFQRRGCRCSHARHNRRADACRSGFPSVPSMWSRDSGGEYGHLRVSSRYVMLPGGQRINVAIYLGRPNRIACATARQLPKRPSQSARQARDRPAKKICARAGTTRARATLTDQTPGEAPQPLTLNHPASNPGRVSGRGSLSVTALRRAFCSGTWRDPPFTRRREQVASSASWHVAVLGPGARMDRLLRMTARLLIAAGFYRPLIRGRRPDRRDEPFPPGR